MEQKQVFSFAFNFDTINVILGALKKLPFEVSAGVIQQIIMDYEKQANPPSVKEENKTEEE